jgi:hypothetical protein
MLFTYDDDVDGGISINLAVIQDISNRRIVPIREHRFVFFGLIFSRAGNELDPS